MGVTFFVYNTLIYKNKGKYTVFAQKGGNLNFCTIADNTSLYIVAVQENNIYLTGNIIHNTYSNYEVYGKSGGGSTPGIRVSYSSIRNGRSGVGGITNDYSNSGNLNLSPGFANPNSNDYHLSDNSACIDAHPYEKDERRPPGKGTDKADLGVYGGPHNVSYAF